MESRKWIKTLGKKGRFEEDQMIEKKNLNKIINLDRNIVSWE